MEKMSHELLMQYDALFEERKQKICQASDLMEIRGNAYFVSNEGDDQNDGKSAQKPWKTLRKVSEARLLPGDGVFFRRGDLFRGAVCAKDGVTYAAYGSGEKPKFYGCHRSLADAGIWEEVDVEHHIWKCTEKMLDAGTLVFNEGQEHSRKLIPTYKYGKFVCREDETKVFHMAEEMTADLDLYWHFDAKLTTSPSKGENFPIPDLHSEDAYGELYLRCDRGNPGNVFDTVESVARTHLFCVGEAADVRIDNLCIKYVGMHGVSAGLYSKGLHVTNCEIGWIGGSIQDYQGTDPNYPEGRRGSVTRFGNAIEVYGGCEDYVAANNYIYEVYDAGITHQVTTSEKVIMKGIRYTGNVIEKCVYGIEYFLDQIEGEHESCMEDVDIKDNFIRLSGYGWGQQRHNIHTPALIKGWSYVNTARNYRIHNNIFDRCAYRMLHLVALKDKYCPQMYHNTYIQYLGGAIGQYGGNEETEPKMLRFDDQAEEKIVTVIKEQDPKVYYISQPED